MDFDSGTQSTFDANGAQIILDLKDGLDFLEEVQGGIALLKRLGLNGFTYANQKQEWDETALKTRSETVTLADGSATSLTVADAHQYAVNELIRIENEIVRVTAIANATTLTIVRGYAGTTGAAHSAKSAYSLGTAEPEGADAPVGRQRVGERLYNYSQTFARTISLSTDQIAALNTDGNPMKGEIKRAYIEQMRDLWKALLYGIRYQDSTNEIYTLGGLKYFLSTNVTNVAGAVTVAAIDAKILAIVQAGGDPKVIGVSPYQKQKLDALDANLVRLGLREKKTNAGGNPNTQTWMSGILTHELDIVVDDTINNDELWILDTDHIKIGHKMHNGIDGSMKVTDATPPGADRQSQVMRGKYSVRFMQEKAHALLYGLN